MILCAFDLATATGVCDGEPNGRPRLWSWFLRDGGDGLGERLLHLHGFLCRYFEKEPCDGVVYEKPIPIGMMNSHPAKGGAGGLFNARARGSGFMLSEDNITFARGAIGVLVMTCAKYGKPVEGLAVQDARQAVLGWRTNKSGEDTKKRVVREVTTLFKIGAENDNEADAAVLWMFACAKTNPLAALQTTPLFGGPMR